MTTQHSVPHLKPSAVHAWRQLTAPSVGHNQCLIGVDLKYTACHQLEGVLGYYTAKYTSV